jgi:hypothetical protein
LISTLVALKGLYYFGPLLQAPISEEDQILVESFAGIPVESTMLLREWRGFRR